LEVCNIVNIPSLLHDCEMWTLKQWDLRRLKTAEVKFMRHTVGYIDNRENWRI